MSTNRIAVIDYGMGNLHSVANALRKVAPEADIVVTADKGVIAGADRVLFPGVGAIRDCMAEIRHLGMDTAVAEAIDSGKPVLAICVGLQALMDSSEENGGVPCLGHFAGEVKSFAGYPEFRVPDSGEKLKVPHMGWNEVRQVKPHPLWQDIPDASRFYFVHSFCVQSEYPGVVSGTCQYGIEFSAALARDNLFAAQFHPEKSHTHGLQLLKNFVNWNGRA